MKITIKFILLILLLNVILTSLSIAMKLEKPNKNRKNKKKKHRQVLYGDKQFNDYKASPGDLYAKSTHPLLFADATTDRKEKMPKRRFEKELEENAKPTEYENERDESNVENRIKKMKGRMTKKKLTKQDKKVEEEAKMNYISPEEMKNLDEE